MYFASMLGGGPGSGASARGGTEPPPPMVSTRKALQPMRAASIWPIAKAALATSSASAPVQNGGYSLALTGDQRPPPASGIDQYGYLVGQWEFE
jgi:hypothetical protein